MNTTAALPDSAWPTLANSSAGWGDRTVPQRFSGTPVPLPRGKGLGGSSAMLDSGYFTAAADVEAVVAGIEAARAITDPAALQAMFDKALGPQEDSLIQGASHGDLHDKEQYVGPTVEQRTGFFAESLVRTRITSTERHPTDVSVLAPRTQ